MGDRAFLRMPRPRRGDLIAVFNAGAYGFSMSMLHFPSHLLPAEAVVIDGEPVMAGKRGTYEDWFLNQLNVQVSPGPRTSPNG